MVFGGNKIGFDGFGLVFGGNEIGFDGFGLVSGGNKVVGFDGFGLVLWGNTTSGLGVGFVGLGGGFLFQRLLLLFFFGIQHCSTMLRFQPGGTEANRDRKEQKNIEQ